MITHISVGRGGWGFQVTVNLPVVPSLGEGIAADGDSRVYTVTSRVVTPREVFLRCDHPFPSQEAADDAWEEWAQWAHA